MGRGTPFRTLGIADYAQSHDRIHTLFMVYGAEVVLPYVIIHDSPRVRMYEEREAELDRQDNLDALEEERDVAKAHSAFYQQQDRKYQSREVQAKTYNVGELVLRLPEKKKDKLKPNGERMRVCIIHGLNISHKELTYLLQTSTSQQKPSTTRMLLGG